MDFDYVEFLSSVLKEKALVELVNQYKFIKPWWNNTAILHRGERFRLSQEKTLTFKGMGGKKSIKTDKFFILWLDYGIGDKDYQRCVLVKPEYYVDNCFYDKTGDEWVKFCYDETYFFFKIEYDFLIKDEGDELTKFLFTIKPYLTQADILSYYKNRTYEQYVDEQGGEHYWFGCRNFTKYEDVDYLEDLINLIDGNRGLAKNDE